MEPCINLLANLAARAAGRGWACDVLLRATIALSLAVLVVLVLRRGSAALRHLVWASALTGSLVLPGLMLAVPAWRVPILPAPRSTVAINPISLSSPLRPAAAAERIAAEGWLAGPSPRERPAAELGPEQRPGPAPGSRVKPWTLAAGGLVGVAVVWGCGVAVVLAPLLAGLGRLRWLRSRFEPMGAGPLRAAIERLGAELGRSRRVVLLQGDDASPPLTWGVFRPVILLPGAASAWHPERVRAVLLHELAHVNRWDCLTQLVGRLTCAVYWFHPLVWLAAHRLRIESERACDDLVLRSGSRASRYAADLLEVARTLSFPTHLGAVAVPMARPSQLEGRLRAILDRSTDRRGVTRRRACLLGALVAAGLLPLSAARLGSPVAVAAAAEQGEAPAPRPARMTVLGRVVGSDGQPASGARVAVLGRRKLATLNARSANQHEVLGRAEADAAGQYRVDVARVSSVTHYEVQVVASRPGSGLGWTELNRDAAAPVADVRLRVEQPIEGRLVDLQGTPVGSVKLRVAGCGVNQPAQGRFDGISFWKQTPPGLEDCWPGEVTTDAAGRFRVAGIGRELQVSLGVNDLRFAARQTLRVSTDAPGESKDVTLVIQAAMRVTGRVTCADTGEPLRDTVVNVGSGSNSYNAGGGEFRTDADGRYLANPAPGKFVKVTVYPAIGSPYLIFERNFEGAEDPAQREVNMMVPRGVLMTGRVTERGTGRPLVGASVFYENGQGNVVDSEGTIPGWMAAVTSDAAGQYAIAVTPGKGSLLVYGPTADFVHEVRGDSELIGKKAAGSRHYAHAFLPYEVGPQPGPVTLDAPLQPGVVVTGRVVGPAGQPVDQAEIVTTLSISPFHTRWRGDFTIPVRDGRFELHGMAPGRPVRCSFLDAKHGWGTTLEVTAEQAAQGPLQVQLQPGGTATARMIDEADQPVAKIPLNLSIVGAPGHGTDYDGETLTKEERGTLAADEELYVNVDRVNYWEGPRSDRDGRITLPRLIPGATYRIYEYQRDRSDRAYRWRDFTVEAGQTTDLGAVRVKSDSR